MIRATIGVQLAMTKVLLANIITMEPLYRELHEQAAAKALNAGLTMYPRPAKFRVWNGDQYDFSRGIVRLIGTFSATHEGIGL